MVASTQVFSEWKYIDLKRECSAKGLSGKGKKDELLERLEEWQRETAASEAADVKPAAKPAPARAAKPKPTKAASAPASKAKPARSAPAEEEPAEPAAQEEAPLTVPKRTSARARKSIAPSKLGYAASNVTAEVEVVTLKVTEAHLIPLPEEAAKQKAVEEPEAAPESEAGAGLSWGFIAAVVLAILLTSAAAILLFHPEAPAIRSQLSTAGQEAMAQVQGRSRTALQRAQSALETLGEVFVEAFPRGGGGGGDAGPAAGYEVVDEGGDYAADAV